MFVWVCVGVCVCSVRFIIYISKILTKEVNPTLIVMSVKQIIEMKFV